MKLKGFLQNIYNKSARAVPFCQAKGYGIVDLAFGQTNPAYAVGLAYAGAIPLIGITIALGTAVALREGSKAAAKLIKHPLNTDQQHVVYRSAFSNRSFSA